jgi:glycosyltransferase involved in cell wall biosynthesis
MADLNNFSVDRPTRNPMTTVSVIIPVWNRAGAIGAAIESVLVQQLPAPDWSVRVIVVDDGSTDDLAGALRPYDSRITLVRHDRNAGAAAARNTGIATACGQYVAFLDSDDTWLPEKLVRQLDFMHTHQFAASCTSFHIMRPNGREITKRTYLTGKLGLEDLVWGCFVSPGSTLICRHDVYGKIGAYDVSLRRLEDWDWLLRYAGTHGLGYLNEPLARIQPSPNPNPQDVLAALEQMEWKHLASLPAREHRRFRAAAEVVRAAAHRWHGNPLAAAAALGRSLRIVPISNVALTTVLHNMLARR